MNHLLLNILLIFSLFLPQLSNGQEVKGVIRDANSKPIPFASIYNPQLQKGTTANMEGEYQLFLPVGEHELLFQYLGYQTHKELISLDSKVVTLDVILNIQHYNLAEVIVTASGEDPAYFVMRKAIGMSQYYRNQVSEYSAKVYLKGTGVPVKIPALMRRQLKKDGIVEGKYFVTETLSEISFKKGEPLRTKVLSTRSSGPDNDTNPMEFVTISLYNDINGIISPLSRDAFSVYRYRLDGTFVENGRTVNKISVIPKRKGQDLYRGTIFIREGSWNIHSVDLKVEQNMFKLRLRQVYQEVKPLVWMPLSHDFDILVEALGGKATFRYVVTVNDYDVKLNPEVDHSFYAKMLAEEESELKALEDLVANAIKTSQSKKNEPPTKTQQRVAELVDQQDLSNKEMRELNKLIRMEATATQKKPPLEIKPRNTEIADSAKLRTPDFWNQARTVPLTTGELESFDEKPADSSNADTLSKKKSSLFNEILFGSTYRKIAPKIKLKHNGLIGLSSFSFNTVDGFLFDKKFGLLYDATSGKQLYIDGNIHFAFARKSTGGVVSAKYLYDPMKRASFKISGGRTTNDFNADDGIIPFFNVFTTLFARQNFLKLYEKDFLKLSHETDITNGLVFSLSAEYAKREKLENHTDFYFTNWLGKEFTANMPPSIADHPELISNNKAFIFEAGMSWTYRHFYRISNGRKQMAYSRYPTVSAIWRQGIKGIGDSESQFQQIEVGIKHGFDMRLYGRIDYTVSAGSFLNTSNIYFADYKHFSNNPLWINSGKKLSMFRTLHFYDRSTKADYFQAHLNYEHSRILIKRLPFLGNSLMRENLFVNNLITKDSKPYLEIGYGVSQIFLMFNIEVVTGFEGGKHNYTGFRLGIPIGEAAVRF
ncbi:MAG: DUF5686 and carboxypeptidase regulatory-like domain-containing protein [Bacteroidales bacterium]|nr:DUF5686 and carboxypeptidase regulatory-like domain-containing protein [Bacteroidales bacterium]